LVFTYGVLEGASLGLVVEVLGNRLIHPLLEVNVQLVLESITPVVLVGQELHALLEVISQEVFGNVEALKLVHGLDLLLALHASVIESLVLLLDALDLFLDLHLPLAVLELATFMVLVLELTNFFELLLLFDLESSLIDGLGQEDVENRLDLIVVVEQVVVLDLGDLVDSSLLWDVRRSGRFRLKLICLQFHFCFIRLCLALLSQEIGEIDLNACRRTWAKVIRTGGVLGLLELEQLRLDHLDLLFLALFLDALLFLLCRS